MGGLRHSPPPLLRFVVGCLLLACLAPGQALAARAKTCLVLGGGGARGVAHIGVLKVLEREHIPVDCITGTSMGAIVGSLYASGYEADEIEQLVHAIDWSKVFHDEPQRPMLPVMRKDDELRFLLGIELGIGRDGKLRLPPGAIQGQQIELLLRRLLLPVWNIERFDELPIPFRTVATDIVNGEAVVFDRGDLALAVRASMSVPGVFAPVRHDGKLLIDGGIVDNVPIDLARGLGAERLIAVNVGTGLRREDQLDSPLNIVMQTVSTLMVRQTQLQLRELEPQDVLIRPDLSGITAASFDDSVQGIPRGEAAAEAIIERLREFSVSAEEYGAWRATHRLRSFDPPLLHFLEVLRNSSESASYVERVVDNQIGTRFDIDAVERAINETYGGGSYQRIGYRLVEDAAGDAGLRVDPQDKSWGPWLIRAGLSISDDFDGRSAYQLGLDLRRDNINAHGAWWHSRLDAGQVTGLRSEFVQPMGEDEQFFVRPWLDYRAFEQPISFGRPTLAEARVELSTLGLGLGWAPAPAWLATLRLETGRDHASLHIGAPGLFDDASEGWGAASLKLTRDTLDSAQFPRSGTRAQLLLTRLLPALGAESDGNVGAFVWDTALSRGNDTLLLGARGHRAWGESDALRAMSFLGGFANLSGYAEREAVGSHSLLLRAVWYHRMRSLDEKFGVPMYLGASLERGNVFFSPHDISWGNLLTAGSVFLGLKTPFGPLFLGYGRNSLGYDALYLNFGNLVRPLD